MTTHERNDSGYGTIKGLSFESSIKDYETDPFERLLALCRIMGLRYEIEPLEHDNSQLYIRVTALSGPPKFFVPLNSPYSSGVIGCKNTKVDVCHQLSSCIAGVFSEVSRNCSQFAYSFMRDWKERTGKEWIETRV